MLLKAPKDRMHRIRTMPKARTARAATGLRSPDWPRIHPKMALDGKREPFEQRKCISGVNAWPLCIGLRESRKAQHGEIRQYVKRAAPELQEMRSIQGRTGIGFPSSGTARLRRAPHQPARPLTVCHTLGNVLRLDVPLHCTHVLCIRRKGHK